MFSWSAPLFRLGLLLLLVGGSPLLVVDLIFPTADPLLPVMLALTVAPLGAFVLAASIIVWIVQRLRRRGDK